MRAFAPFVAGSSGMRYRAFVPYSILGTGLWVSSAILLGYFFSRSIDTVLDLRRQGRLRARRLIVVIVGIVALRRFLRVEENRREAVRWMEGTRRDPLARRARPGGSGRSSCSSGIGSRRVAPSGSSSRR